MHSKGARSKNMQNVNTSVSDKEASPKSSTLKGVSQRNSTVSPAFNPYGASPSRTFLGSPVHESPSNRPHYPIDQTDMIGSSDVGNAFRSKVFAACALNTFPDNSGSLMSPNLSCRIGDFTAPSIDFAQLQSAQPFPEMAHVRIDEYFDSRGTFPSPSVTDAFRLQVFSACSRAAREPASPGRPPISPTSRLVPPSGGTSAFLTAFTSPDVVAAPNVPIASPAVQPVQSQASNVSPAIQPVVQLFQIATPAAQSAQIGSPRVGFAAATIIPSPLSRYDPPTDFLDNMNLPASPRRSAFVSFPSQNLYGDILLGKRSNIGLEVLAPEVPVYAAKRSRNDRNSDSPRTPITPIVTDVSKTPVVVSPKSQTPSVVASPKEGPSVTPAIAKNGPSKTPGILASPNTEVAKTPIVLSPKSQTPSVAASPKEDPSKTPASPKEGPSKTLTSPKEEPSKTPASPKNGPSKTPEKGIVADSNFDLPKTPSAASPKEGHSTASPKNGFIVANPNNDASKTPCVGSPKEECLKSTPAQQTPVVTAEPPAEVFHVSPSKLAALHVSMMDVAGPADSVADNRDEDPNMEEVQNLETASPVFDSEPKSAKRGCFVRFLCP